MSENALQVFPTGFDTTSLIGQDLLSRYFLAIAMATLLSMAAAIGIADL